MGIATYEGIVENGCVILPSNVHLNEKTLVSVVVSNGKLPSVDVSGSVEHDHAGDLIDCVAVAAQNSARYDEAIATLLSSPSLPDAIEELTRVLKAETVRRHAFYEWMTEDMKVEFINGEIVMQSPARRAHMTASGRLYRLMSTWVDAKKLGDVLHEKCLCEFPRNDYEPDIVFFCPEKAVKFTDDTLKFPVPDLIVEVLSKSTEKKDRIVKFGDFEAHGVREYWIIDEWKRNVEQYLLRDGRLDLKLKSDSGNIASDVMAGFKIPIRAIFDTDENLKALWAMKT